MSFPLWNIDHNILPAIIDFQFDLLSHTWRTVVLFLTSKTSVNRRSDFLTMVFMTVTEAPGDIGLLSVNLSVVETIYTPRIALYFC